MLSIISNKIQERPLFYLLLLALFLNLIAAFTAHGYYAYDDYFKVVDISWGWVNGENTDNWFVSDYQENDSLRSVIYPGVIAGLLWIANLFTKVPFYQMIFVQLVHAIYALFIPYFVYKITLELSNKKVAFLAGLLTISMWFFPFMAVRTLGEWVCIPPVLGAFYLYYKNREGEKSLVFLSIGILLAIAFHIRFQSAFIITGFGVAMLLKKEFKLFILMTFGFLLYTIPVQGYGDYLLCNMPFGKLIEYVDYNLTHSGDYITRPVFDYIIIIPCLFLPPIGLLLFVGSFFNIKKHLHLFLAMIIFLVIHSVFENKQERFIFPILPFFLIIGTIGLNTIFQKTFWIKRPYLKKGFWVFFIAMNTFLLAVMTTNYTKKSKVELMRYIETEKDVSTIVVENALKNGCVPLPDFYAGKRLNVICLSDGWQERTDDVNNLKKLKNTYIAFEVMPDQNLTEERLNAVRSVSPDMTYIKRINGSLIDNFRFNLNKILKNYEYEVYRVN